MDKIEKIRAEIDRRYNEYSAKKKTDDFIYYSGMADALDLFEQFLDTLSDESEQPINGYDEAYLNEKIAKASKTWEGVDVDKYMNEVRDRELDMYDPQYLDMNYERYYFIPWPDSQLFEEEDPEKEFIVPVEGGVFLSMEWLNKNE